jgi:hypothetical protein
MKGSVWESEGMMRLEENGKKCWRVMERECLRMGSVV